MSAAAIALRDRRLRALGVEPLRLRRAEPIGVSRPATGLAGVPPAAGPMTAPDGRAALSAHAIETPVVPATAAPSAPTQGAAAPTARIRRLALQPDPAELRDPAVHAMYTALTEAVSKAGLQAVRPCDVGADPSAVVMVFGAAPVPEGVPAVRVLREDPLAILQSDRGRKRRLWQRMQALARGEEA